MHREWEEAKEVEEDFINDQKKENHEGQRRKRRKRNKTCRFCSKEILML